MQGEIALRPAWPEDTVFRRLVLDVESDSCEHCGATLPSSNLHWWSAPESKSGALLDGVFPPSPHKWPNQPWTAPEVPGGHVDSKLLAGCYLWFKRALAARTDSGCELNWPRMVSDGAGQSNLCPQLCPVVGTGPKMEKKASRNWLLRLALRMSGRLDSNQRPPEPHSGSAEGKLLGKYGPFVCCGFSKLLKFYKNSAIFQAFLCPTLPFSALRWTA